MVLCQRTSVAVYASVDAQRFEIVLKVFNGV